MYVAKHWKHVYGTGTQISEPKTKSFGNAGGQKERWGRLESDPRTSGAKSDKRPRFITECSASEEDEEKETFQGKRQDCYFLIFNDFVLIIQC